LYFYIDSQIKAGAFATVFEGTHRVSQKKVAIKCTLRKKISPRDDAAVFNEIGILAAMKHKYVCPIIDFFMQDDCYFMVMEYTGGGDLFDRLDHKGTYNESDARDLCTKLLETVAFLHDNNIAHCDLKHNNLLLMNKDDDTYIKVADFGFASRIYGPSSLSCSCGTPYFIGERILNFYCGVNTPSPNINILPSLSLILLTSST